MDSSAATLDAAFDGAVLYCQAYGVAVLALVYLRYSEPAAADRAGELPFVHAAFARQRRNKRDAALVVAGLLVCGCAGARSLAPCILAGAAPCASAGGGGGLTVTTASGVFYEPSGWWRGGVRWRQWVQVDGAVYLDSILPDSRSLGDEALANEGNEAAQARWSQFLESQRETRVVESIGGTLRLGTAGSRGSPFVDTSIGPWTLRIISGALMIVLSGALSVGAKLSTPVDAALDEFLLRAAADSTLPLSLLRQQLQLEFADATRIESSSCELAVAERWIAAASSNSLHLFAIEDCEHGQPATHEYFDNQNQRIPMVTTEIRRAGTNQSFSVTIPQALFGGLGAFLDRVSAAKEAAESNREELYIHEWALALEARRQQGHVHHMWEGGGDCIACSQDVDLVKILKRCESCSDRSDCPCKAQFCGKCLLKWWIRAQTESLPRDATELLAAGGHARCPTCRVDFCLHDVFPCAVDGAEPADAEPADDVEAADVAEPGPAAEISADAPAVGGAAQPRPSMMAQLAQERAERAKAAAAAAGEE